MARSQYIYMVVDQSGGPVLAVFTVKHELITWLDRRTTGAAEDEVWRHHDGGDPAACFMGTVGHVATQAGVKA